MMNQGMRVEIDVTSHVPIYVQIVDRIRGLVATGALKPGDQLPTVRQLATELRVNFNTVARSYRILDEAGLISTQQGRGTYVLEPPRPERLKKLRQAGLESLIRAFLADAGQMGFHPDEVRARVEEMIDRWRESGNPPVEPGS